MKTKITTAVLMLGMSITAQTITDKNGYSIDLKNYEEVSITRSTNKTKAVMIVADGYDVIVISEGSEIVDQRRVITDRAVTFSNKDGFWMAFMKRCGYVLEDTKTRAKKKNAITKLLPLSNRKETTLTFIKK